MTPPPADAKLNIAAETVQIDVVAVEDIDAKIECIKREIKDEYRAPHSRPWLIGFSGGKDSTLVLHLVVESLLELPAVMSVFI
jgi:3'-phosphoadenosine 5'-phosphosulfate sulfotransferase (PAPS reductase)/FAD synthetase